jgi:hypothetical protein
MAFLERNKQAEENNAVTEFSQIYTVDNSKYIKYFNNQILELLPTNDLKHFIILDETDTCIELLANCEPILYEVVDGTQMSGYKD